MDCVGFTLIIDDIVLPDGTTFMQQLGGGGKLRVVFTAGSRPDGPPWCTQAHLTSCTPRKVPDAPVPPLSNHTPAPLAKLCLKLPCLLYPLFILCAGAQTLFGFQLISQVCLGCVAKLGLAAGVGTDLPAPHKDWLRGIGVDVSGLIEGQLPTPRAWQLFEEDGTRTQVCVDGVGRGGV